MKSKRIPVDDSDKMDSSVALKSNKRIKIRKTRNVFAPTQKYLDDKKKQLGAESANNTKVKKEIVQTPKDPEKEAKKFAEALDYLACFATSKHLWKFQKLTQIFIYQNVFSDKFDKKAFKYLLKYLKDSKGKSREDLLVRAKELFESEDTANEDETQTEPSEVEKAKTEEISTEQAKKKKLQKLRAAEILALLA